jgi:hypothetical protein
VARCARRSRSREPRRDVIRYVPANRRRALESCLVASIAIRRAEGVVVVDVTGGAGRRGWGHVRSGQGKPGRAVVKSCRRPTNCCMADRTVRWRKLRTRRGVHRIVRLLPGRQMAARVPTIARGGRQVVVVIDVA